MKTYSNKEIDPKYWGKITLTSGSNDLSKGLIYVPYVLVTMSGSMNPCNEVPLSYLFPCVLEEPIRFSRWSLFKLKVKIISNKFLKLFKGYTNCSGPK